MLQTIERPTGLLSELFLDQSNRFALEAAIARHVEQAVDVDSERIQFLPSEATCELFEQEFERFAAFADGLGVSALPANGHTAAFYLLDMLANDASLDEIATAAAAIRYAHTMGQRYVEWLPIAAALEFAITQTETKGNA
jgi:hypothetical protein